MVHLWEAPQISLHERRSFIHTHKSTWMHAPNIVSSHGNEQNHWMRLRLENKIDVILLEGNIFVYLSWMDIIFFPKHCYSLFFAHCSLLVQHAWNSGPLLSEAAVRPVSQAVVVHTASRFTNIYNSNINITFYDYLMARTSMHTHIRFLRAVLLTVAAAAVLIFQIA